MTTSVSGSNSGATNGLGPPYGALGRNRAWMLAPGVVAIASGVIGIVVLFSLAIVDVKYIGVLLLIAGFAQAAVAPLLQGLEGYPLAHRHRCRLRHRRNRDPVGPSAVIGIYDFCRRRRALGRGIGPRGDGSAVARTTWLELGHGCRVGCAPVGNNHLIRGASLRLV